MKATMSKDGKERVTLRVEFRLDKEQMVILLATHATVYGDIGGKLSEAEALRFIRDQLMFSGTDVLDFGSNDEVPEETIEWAQGIVERIWK
jgi:hypothetical protein